MDNAAAKVHINPRLDIDDFVFVTDPWIVDYLKGKNINVVLQSPDAPNDGSLSVYAAMLGIPYVNIEVQDGHLRQHRELIDIRSEEHTSELQTLMRISYADCCLNKKTTTR